MTFADEFCAFSVTICAFRADCIAMFTLLFIEDDEAIRTALRLVLEDEGYEVAEASDGETGIKMFGQIDPDLVLLDLRLPDISGFEVCRAIRRTSITPVIMVTAQTDTSDLVNGFDAGADDYITKPIKPKVLLSRLKALLRRTGGESSSNSEHSLDQGKLVIDKEKYQVIFNGNVLDLPRKEFELISLLSSKPGKVFPRDEIMDRIWGNDVVVGGRTIDVHIRKIREKIGDKSIKTIKGVGYKFDEQA